MAKSTRFATTIATRNLATPQGTDAFFLDGRLSGPRDARGTDSTLDREDRGFFFALFNAGPEGAQTSQAAKHLNKVFQLIKSTNRGNIDDLISDLADCATHTVGDLSLGEGAQRQCFTSLVVQDGEATAVTVGRGCAYLYRNDSLYPLTQSDYPLSAVDQAGHPIPNFDLYCAGTAAHIRYSNIVALQPDDCFILCNREVMETLGQQQMLAILDECYDQQDAAVRVSEEMARRNPGATAQFMIGLVENIQTLDKAGLKSLTGRMGWTQKSLGRLSGTQDATQMPPLAAAAPAAAAMGTAGGANPAQPGYDQSYTPLAQPQAMPAQPGQTAPAAADQSFFVQQQGYPQQGYPQQGQPMAPGYPSMQPQDRAMLNGMPAEQGLSTAKKAIIIAIGVIILILIGVLVYFGLTRMNRPQPTQTAPAAAVLKPTNRPRPSELFPDLPKKTNKRPSVSRRPNPTREVTRPTDEQDKDVNNQNNSSDNDQGQNSSNNQNDQNTANKPSTNPSAGQKYTVQDGDTLWGLATANAKGADLDEYMKKIIQANQSKATADGTNLNLFPGDEIIIPAP